MPSTYNIPSRQERHCEPCEFHKMFSAMFGGPGNVWRDYNCVHPEAYDDIHEPLSDDPKIAAKQGELRARLLEHGRHIGKTELQPDWCPLRRNPEQPAAK